jgi:hypothetical protein
MKPLDCLLAAERAQKAGFHHLARALIELYQHNKKHMKTEQEHITAFIGTRRINYPYHVGQLQAVLRYCLPYGVIPGVTITDKAAVNEWIETELERLIQEAEKFERDENKPIDNEPMV